MQPKGTLEDIRWMVGPWHGYLDPDQTQSIEEKWSEASGGTMSTMVRLTSAQATIMIELIAIRETEGSLVLHLRQFSPSLETRLSQDMPLHQLTAESVVFATSPTSHIPQLAYRLTGENSMEVDVTMTDGTVLTGALSRG